MPDFTVTAPQDEWIKILDMLGNYSFKKSAYTINMIQQQMQRQMQEHQQNPQRANGEMRQEQNPHAIRD